jgi:putative aminopeptidase FrvX
MASLVTRRLESTLLTTILLIPLALPVSVIAGPTLSSGPTPAEINSRLRSAPYNNTQREALLRRWFEVSGCSHPTQELVSTGHPPNLICTLKGESRSLVLVAGHLDHVKKGMGVVDDWSGASMLPDLFQALNTRPRKHTFMFIGFTEEEKGLVGSAFFVHHLAESEKIRIRAMVNLECLGLAPPEVWSDHANPRLLSGLLYLARRLGVPVRGIDLERVGRDDAESFRKAGIPTITIHSLTQNTVHIMHTPNDEFSAIKVTDYDESYKLVAAYLAYLDGVLR